jgi:zinc transport system ATP-binding protein
MIRTNCLASLKKVSYKINDQEILKDINLEVNKGQITTLIGPNGGGKTSIAHILIGILQPSSGEVFIKKNAKIGYMPQKINIENIIPLRVIDFLDLANFDKENHHLKINILAKKFGIEQILTQQIHDISGGQLQKVSLVRSLLNNPDILVLDEPTQFMDISAQGEFYNLIEDIRKQKECAILMISHDLHMVMQTTNQVICINRHICCKGSPESIHKHPEYISLFGQHKIDNIAIYSHHHDHKHC